MVEEAKIYNSMKNAKMILHSALYISIKLDAQKENPSVYLANVKKSKYTNEKLKIPYSKQRKLM